MPRTPLVAERHPDQVFIACLVGGKGSISAILDPHPKDIAETFKKRLVGMTDIGIRLKDLLQMQSQLSGMVRNLFSAEDKEFLLSFKRGNPNRNLLPIPYVQKFPTIQWKSTNDNKRVPKPISDFHLLYWR